MSASFVGPGNIVSGATAWYGAARCYSKAYANGTNKALNLRRASDNATQDIVCLSNGNVDAASANTFAGTDATASCTIAGTTATCTGASSTPHVSSTVTGSGVTSPCVITAVGTFTAGAGTFTASLAGTSTSCGTIGVAVTLTMQYGLFVTTAYDQSGNTRNASQGTAGLQVSWLPTCINSLPCFYGSSASDVMTMTLGAGVPQPFTVSTVAIRVNNFSTEQAAMNDDVGHFGISFKNTPNTLLMYAGGANKTATALDSVVHSILWIFNTTSSYFYVDGTNTSANSPGGNNGNANWRFPVNNTGRLSEVGIWSSAFSAGQSQSMCNNQGPYYGLGLTCN